jgi:membrane protease YdiL (CAAX protease family)
MSEPDTLISEPRPRPVNLLPFGIGAIVFTLLFSLGSTVGGELGSFMTASTNAMPFAVLAVLAYMGGRRPNWAWVATGLWLTLMIGLTSLTALGLSIATLSDGALLAPESPPQFVPGALLSISLLVLGILVSIGLGALLLIPAVRQALARVLPFDPASFVHATALITVVVIGLICAMPLLVLGAPPLLALVDVLVSEAGDDGAGQLRATIYGLIWTIPATILAVGFGIQRDLREALTRLGLVRPSLRQVAAGVVVALLLVGAVQLLGLGLDWLWGLMGWPATDTEAFAELLAYAINPIGAVVIGVSAGLGEELAVRGVLQPRMGLLLSNLFFVSLHALQYSWDALLVVFVVGLVCGVVRNYSNTSTAAIVHGVYNFTLIMLALL